MPEFSQRGLTQILWEAWPAAATLLLAFFIATFVTPFTFASGNTSAGVILWRFCRLLLNFVIPLLFLPFLCIGMARLINRGPRKLVQVREEEESGFRAFQAWVVRPFQGIGLTMFLAGRLFGALRSLEGSAAATSSAPPGGFTWERTLNLAIASLLLSFLWTMDDLRVRHYNEKTGENRMVGKYAGSIVPIVTGFYGMYHYFQNQSPSTALWLILQVIIIFYPPLVAFYVVHQRYLNRYKSFLLTKMNVLPIIHFHAHPIKPEDQK